MPALSWLSWENPVSIWWVLLSAAAVVNISFWIWTWNYKYRSAQINRISQLWHNRSNMIWFSALYVFVCAFRSILPRADVQRICLYDTWFSSVLVGRTVATIGELAFVAQWVIVLRFLSQETKSHVGLKISYWILPLIATAECFSWYAVIRTHYLGNAIEESLWAVTYTLIAIALVSMISKFNRAFKLTAGFALIGCVFYVAFMSLVDVPMYVTRLIADTAANKALFGLFDGLYDLNTRWIVTHSIHDWKSEIPWQTLYFTFAVLVSIAMCYVPLTSEKIKKHLVV